MDFSKHLSIGIALFIFQVLVLFPSSAQSASNNSNLFREYIGAEFKNVKFSDLPINSQVEFHFILSSHRLHHFLLRHPNRRQLQRVLGRRQSLPSSSLSHKKPKPQRQSGIELRRRLRGRWLRLFQPSSVNSWLSNAVSSLTSIIQEYNLDGIDIDYEHFKTDPETFSECIGKLISTLKNNGVISFASIAPYDDDEVQSHYMALWRSYGHIIDYVNFQFYAYDKGTSVSEFLDYFGKQSSNYNGGKVLASFISDGSGGLAPDNGFFTACSRLKSEGNLHGIFVWSADDSKGLGFKYEKQSQSLLAIPH
ncbi:UNVERIFIED_CONTAM: Chitinase 1 [Sesamum angustifolium]|uniref:Chitinase 1 n=1 Tax=Sesamum angustifolium TaxID=2727405 RepID=A0AAW2QQB3_9LAMI